MRRCGAVVVALTLAASGCARVGAEPRVTRALVDELEGSYRGVRMGDSEREVRRALGDPSDSPGLAPAGKSPAEVGVPQSIPAPGGRPKLLKYDDVAFLVGPEGVYSLIVTEEGARTRRGVAIGDSLDEARRAYDLRCIEVAGGESPFGVSTYPSCSTTIGGRIRVWFGRDPIRSVTLLSLPRSR